ncbi:N-acetylmuramoyl-L-alanine amidase [Klebsiella variicola]|uniref:N-acetylmuramoyl-L-alanine amidase n=1 Tax=Klebsiella variicola TaxID=244366 RepID=UPI001C81DD11|nr:N-acetylmuramoyl-L-alanine amidase [Klebsiella variicola]MBX4609828.1 N-acetylmuramoyl-L-alanine amidase AmiA [Klebsiella variicola]
MFPGTTRRQLILTGMTTRLTSTLLNPVSYACSPSSQKNKPGSTHKPRVMIDPGHGGKDPGAIGFAGTEEKHVVLDTAKYLQARLTMNGVDARLTRMDDIFVPLYERVLMAHHYKADLLVSLHADGFTSPNAQGASVFALSTRGATSAMASYLSDSENAADIIPGENSRAKDRYLQEAVFDPEQTETIRESLALGRQLIDHIAPVHTLHTRQTEQAAFSVLKSPFIPSVLVEMAFITHPEEEKLLSTPSFRHRMAGAMAEGIMGYLNSKKLL